MSNLGSQKYMSAIKRKKLRKSNAIKVKNKIIPLIPGKGQWRADWMLQKIHFWHWRKFFQDENDFGKDELYGEKNSNHAMYNGY